MAFVSQQFNLTNACLKLAFYGVHSLHGHTLLLLLLLVFKIVTLNYTETWCLNHTKVILIKLPKLAMLQSKTNIFQLLFLIECLKQTSVRFRFIDSKVFCVHILLSKNGRLSFQQLGIYQRIAYNLNDTHSESGWIPCGVQNRILLCG